MKTISPNLHLLLPFTTNYHQSIEQTILGSFEQLKPLEDKHIIIIRNNQYLLAPSKLKRSLITTLETMREYEFYINHPELAELIWHLTIYFPIIITKKGSDQKIIIIGKPIDQTTYLLKKHPKLKPLFITFEKLIELQNQNHNLIQDIAKYHVLCGRKEKIINLLMEHYSQQIK